MMKMIILPLSRGLWIGTLNTADETASTLDEALQMLNTFILILSCPISGFLTEMPEPSLQHMQLSCR